MKTNRILSMLALMLCAFFVVSCDKDETWITRWKIASFYYEREDIAPAMLFKDIGSVDSPVENNKWLLVWDIDGFEFEEGYEYTLEMEMSPHHYSEPARPKAKCLRILSKNEKETTISEEEIDTDFGRWGY